MRPEATPLGEARGPLELLVYAYLKLLVYEALSYSSRSLMHLQTKPQSQALAKP
jgi:hypothetical protein